MAATKRLARDLGLVSAKASKASVDHKKVQPFKFLIVLDFEATCWGSGEVQYPNEIIEFPAVLMSTDTGEHLSEFQNYVQPMEHSKLSTFCTSLTGIVQEQVDESAPLEVCLAKFCRWLRTCSTQFKFSFHEGGENLCTFVTWSDWDLGVCLLQECRRKYLAMPKLLRSWIDLKITYTQFYKRSGRGLRNCVQGVGLVFEGRPHSGIVDSRNTARLAYKMIQDGCILNITKILPSYSA